MEIIMAIVFIIPPVGIALFIGYLALFDNRQYTYEGGKKITPYEIAMVGEAWKNKPPAKLPDFHDGTFWSRLPAPAKTAARVAWFIFMVSIINLPQHLMNLTFAPHDPISDLQVKFMTCILAGLALCPRYLGVMVKHVMWGMNEEYNRETLPDDIFEALGGMLMGLSALLLMILNTIAFFYGLFRV